MKIIVQNSNRISQKIKHLPQADIIILTETHLLNHKKENILNNLESYSYEVAESSRNTRGIAILYKKNIKIHSIRKCIQGCYISITTAINNIDTQIIGIYIPPSDKTLPESGKMAIQDLINIMNDNQRY